MTAMTLAGCGSSSTQETKAATTEATVSEAASEASEALGFRKAPEGRWQLYSRYHPVD